MADSQLLAPWEYRGEIPQVVEAGAVLWNRRPARFELLQEENYAGVHNLKISLPGDDGGWDVHRSNYGVFSCEKVQKDVTNAANKKWIRRVFYIDSEEVRIQPNGTGYWYQSDGTMSNFHLGCSVANLTSSQTYRMILDLMARPSSDVAHALRFKRMDLLEKRYRTFGFASGEQYSWAKTELRALCRLVLYSDRDVWNGRPNLRWLLKATSRRDVAHFWSGRWPINHCDSARLTFWAKVLEQFGPVRPRLKRLCVREYFQFDLTLAWSELAAPSFHEQLEARLELRAWVQENLPVDVRAEIERHGY